MRLRSHLDVAGCTFMVLWNRWGLCNDVEDCIELHIIAFVALSFELEQARGMFRSNDGDMDILGSMLSL
ncbi:hypothetical protein AAHA92_07443 [Salvia divinorum]|uniref:Uncharacterized protein n=1 Tax=Salvia divinorum TaxID=28513 RepID=A0ABD1I901_SALDI